MSTDKVEGSVLASIGQASTAFIDEVIDHTKKTWGNVTSGKGTFAEYAEAGGEVALTAAVIFAAGRFGVSRFLGRGSKALGETTATGSDALLLGTKVAPEAAGMGELSSVLSKLPPGGWITDDALAALAKLPPLPLPEMSRLHLADSPVYRAACGNPYLMNINIRDRAKALDALVGMTSDHPSLRGLTGVERDLMHAEIAKSWVLGPTSTDRLAGYWTSLPGTRTTLTQAPIRWLDGPDYYGFKLSLN